MKIIDLLKSDKDTKWPAISAITAVLALIFTVFFSSIQIARSYKIVKKQAESESQRTNEQREIDSLRFAAQFNLTTKHFESRMQFDSTRLEKELYLFKENFEKQRNIDSNQFDKQFRYSVMRFRNQRKFDSISIERQFDTLYSHFIKNTELTLKQLELARRQMNDQRDLALKQIKAEEESIMLVINQRKKASLLSLISDLENKKKLLLQYFKNVEHFQIGSDPKLRPNKKEINKSIEFLKNQTENNYFNTHQSDINYSLQEFENYLNSVNSFYRDFQLVVENIIQVKGYYAKGKETIYLLPKDYDKLRDNIQYVELLCNSIEKILEQLRTVLDKFSEK